MKKIIKYQNLIIFFSIFLLLVLPYFGTFGATIIEIFGKYYYACLVAIMGGLFLIFRKKTSFFSKNKKIIYLLIGLLLGMCLLLVTSKNSFNNSIFIFVLLLFFYLFSNLKFDDYLIRKMANISLIFFIILFLFSLSQKMTYFNPNGYAYIGFILCSFYIISLPKTRKGILIAFIATLFSIYFSQQIYESENQLIGATIFLFLFVFKDFIFKHKFMFIITITVTFLFMILFPFISYYLIKINVLDTDFITQRGQLWIQAIDELMKVGFFNITEINLRPHNGFLDLSMKYSMCFAVLFLTFLYTLILNCYKSIKNNDLDKNIFLLIMVIIIENSIEGGLVHLTDSYFMYLLIAILLFRNNNAKILTETKKEIFMDNIELKKIKTIELEILNATVEAFEKMNLRYSLDYGSMLGAVRHKGFIPWDDDIDISMPRRDYEKFLKEGSKYLCNSYSIQSIYHDRHYGCHFAKVRKKKSTLFEENNEIAALSHGVYIDIFPTDFLLKDKKIVKMYKLKIKLLSTLCYNSCIEVVDNELGFLKSIARTIIFLLNKAIGKNRIAKELDKQLKKYSENSHASITFSPTIHEVQKIKDYFEADMTIYDQTILMDFERYQFKVLTIYDTWLTLQYNNYLEIPKKEDQISNHSYLYFSANKKSSAEELKYIRKSKE